MIEYEKINGVWVLVSEEAPESGGRQVTVEDEAPPFDPKSGKGDPRPQPRRPHLVVH